MRIEEKSSHLLEESKNAPAARLSLEFKTALIFFLLICSAYTGYWFYAKDIVRRHTDQFISDMQSHPVVKEYRGGEISITGYPQKMKLQLFNQTWRSEWDTLNIKALEFKAWPAPRMPIDIKAYDISLSRQTWMGGLQINSIDATIQMTGSILNIRDFLVKSDDLMIRANGEIDLEHTPYPKIHLNLEIEGVQSFLQKLIKYKVITSKQAMVAGVSLGAMEQGGKITTTLSTNNNKLYFGLLKILELPAAPRGHISAE